MQDAPSAGMPPQPEPLRPDELEPLWRRERQVSWLQIAAMGAFLLAAVIGQRDWGLGWLMAPLFTAVFALLVVASGLQLSVRCPRCRMWLRGKLLRILPSRCPRCGVEFPRQP